MSTTIGERIKQARKSKKVTLVDLGAKIGISASSISKIEIGINNPADRTVKLIAQALGVREDWLKTGEGDPDAGVDRDAMIAEVARTYNLDESSEALLRVFLELQPRQRAAVAALVHGLAEAHRNGTPPPEVPEAPPQEG